MLTIYNKKLVLLPLMFVITGLLFVYRLPVAFSLMSIYAGYVNADGIEMNELQLDMPSNWAVRTQDDKKLAMYSYRSSRGEMMGVIIEHRPEIKQEIYKYQSMLENSDHYMEVSANEIRLASQSGYYFTEMRDCLDSENDCHYTHMFFPEVNTKIYIYNYQNNDMEFVNEFLGGISFPGHGSELMAQRRN